MLYIGNSMLINEIFIIIHKRNNSYNSELQNYWNFIMIKKQISYM
jgi:hypothetical protein